MTLQFLLHLFTRFYSNGKCEVITVEFVFKEVVVAVTATRMTYTFLVSFLEVTIKRASID